MLSPGSRVGDTNIIGKIAVDHLATYYRCTPLRGPDTGPFLTGKLVHGHHTPDAARLRQTIVEARHTIERPHPNLVRTVGAHEHGGQAFIVQEFFSGPRLVDVLTLAWRQGVGHLGPLCTLIADVARGLHHAHRHAGFVHGDVSLENMLVFPDGVGKLLDVDLAGVKARMGQTLRPGRIEYTSPEAVSAGRLDHRSDIYGLGIALYRATTGVFPFIGDSPEQVLAARNRDRPRSPSSIVSDYPARLEQLVYWMLERDPGARPRTALELANALTAFARNTSGGFGPSSVRSWLGDLYPAGTDAWTASDPTTTRTPLPQRISPAPASDRMARLLSRAMGGVGVLTATAVLVVALLSGSGTPPNEALIRAMLDEASVLVMNEQLDRARTVLRTVEDMGPRTDENRRRLQAMLEDVGMARPPTPRSQVDPVLERLRTPPTDPSSIEGAGGGGIPVPDLDPTDSVAGPTTEPQEPR